MRLIVAYAVALAGTLAPTTAIYAEESSRTMAVSYTHLRAHET